MRCEEHPQTRRDCSPSAAAATFVACPSQRTSQPSTPRNWLFTANTIPSSHPLGTLSWLSGQPLRPFLKGQGDVKMKCVCVCVHACVRVCTCSPVCVHGARKQLRKREKKKEKLTWKKVPTKDLNLKSHACGATVLSSVLSANWCS